MESQEKEDIIRAKQAISPDGLEDQSVEGNSGPGSVIDPEPLPTDELEDKYMDGDEVGENVHELHQNRNMHKPNDTTGPAYS
ncbi:hypothetical protein [Spirosoma sp. KUDC1026]|uniref:hypothetical protein n=1 Tax=Spirosoma sp. KUDC1026 TaxID=2745947 RepID=UPI00159BBECB|nr:hypothetical protein [Spirosoma sp. KUDC1026]QKZ14137.1 hypothetical protein HU175_16485 [Spirosoma sp. KUDC1026]